MAQQKPSVAGSREEAIWSSIQALPSANDSKPSSSNRLNVAMGQSVPVASKKPADLYSPQMKDRGHWRKDIKESKEASNKQAAQRKFQEDIQKVVAERRRKAALAAAGVTSSTFAKTAYGTNSDTILEPIDTSPRGNFTHATMNLNPYLNPGLPYPPPLIQVTSLMLGAHGSDLQQYCHLTYPPPRGIGNMMVKRMRWSAS